MKKFGFFGKGRIQPYRCRQCGKTISAIPSRPFDDHRISPEKAIQIVHLLVEGVGIRAIERLTGVTKPTVLAVLQTVGAKCARLLDRKLTGVNPEYVQVDEIWTYTGCKQSNTVPADVERGDQYLFLAVDRYTKLILAHRVAKRDVENAYAFMEQLRQRLPGYFQLTTDGFTPYSTAVYHTFGASIAFAQLAKIYANPNEDGNPFRRYSPSRCIGSRVIQRIGWPAEGEISTSHVERTNLSIRLFNRRFTRLTLGYSKTLENLRHAVALFIAHFNFCRVHGSLGKTPAMAASLAVEPWTIEELLRQAD